mgnify:CR=1 FL=1
MTFFFLETCIVIEGLWGHGFFLDTFVLEFLLHVVQFVHIQLCLVFNGICLNTRFVDSCGEIFCIPP